MVTNLFITTQYTLINAEHGAAGYARRRASADNRKRPGRRGLKTASVLPGVLVAVLLDARSAQAGEAMLVNRNLPTQEFVDRERVTRARFF